MDILDEIDERLIHLLEQNAHQNSKFLAMNLGVSSITVRRRLNKLIQNGTITIKAVKTSINSVITLMGFNIDIKNKYNINNVVDQFANRNEVKGVFVTTGRFNVMLLAQFSSVNDIDTFLQELNPRIEGLIRMEVFFCVRPVKYPFS